MSGLRPVWRGRGCAPARPALHVHWTCDAGRAGAQLPSEALDRTLPSDVLRRIARERVPTADTFLSPCPPAQVRVRERKSTRISLKV